ncbi:MAG TPA: GYF domain-containing protein, partial [Gemmataceae bacterium]|nr:GYF domain-containing protein [Gemmataceae bacterium]
MPSPDQPSPPGSGGAARAGWHYAVGGKIAGPVPFAVLQRLAAAGQFGRADYVLAPGAAKWTPAAHVPHLFAAPPAAPPPAPAEAWYVAAGEQRFGPYTREQLRRMAAERRIGPAHLLWRQGSAAWQPASSLPGLFPSAAAPRPPARRRRPRRRWLIAWAGLAAVGVGVLVLCLLLRGPGGAPPGPAAPPAPPAHPAEAAAAAGRAADLFHQGDYAGAVAACDEAVKLDADWAEPLRLRGVAHEGMGRADDARADFAAADRVAARIRAAAPPVAVG